MKKIIKDTKEYLGKKVNVVMDRKLGTKHPKWGFVYPVNYGFIPNTISGDGEELDAYVLGVEQPIDEFKGVVKAIIHRVDDNDDKLVVMEKDKEFSKEEIFNFVQFQEKYFSSNIIWLDGSSESFIKDQKLIDDEKILN